MLTPLLFTHSAACAVEQATPNVTRTENGSALTGPVEVGVNETISIWCSARATIMLLGPETLRGLFWQDSNGTRVPVVKRGESSGLDVYADIVSNGTGTWKRVLRFNRAQPSSAGNYTCVAKYNHTLKSQSVRVTGR